MLRWFVELTNNEEKAKKIISCDSYVEALNKARNLWDSIGEEEKSKKIIKESRFCISEADPPIIVSKENSLIEMRVVIADSDERGKRADPNSPGYYECTWIYHGFGIKDTTTGEIIEYYDTYYDAKTKLKELKNKYKNDEEFHYILANDTIEGDDLEEWVYGKGLWITFEKITMLLSGMNHAEISRKFGIPIRTVENWDYGKSEPNDYILGMLTKELTEYYIVHHIFDGEEEVELNE